MSALQCVYVCVIIEYAKETAKWKNKEFSVINHEFILRFGIYLFAN